MKPKELVELGIPQDCLGITIEALKSSGVIHKPKDARAWITALAANPEGYRYQPPPWNELAEAIISSKAKYKQETEEWGKNPLGTNANYPTWGGESIDENAHKQMKEAMCLPIAVAGSLQADAHLGYGLPIGGVLATYNSVIPIAVGVDISCRVKLTITDLPVKILDDVFSPKVDPLIRSITGGTVFGVGGQQKVKLNHPVMDMDWNVTRTTKEMKDRAWVQMGTSGSGNHFVEYGVVTLSEPQFGLESGTYVALLSHSGSRGAGSAVCMTYSHIAKSKLPKAYEQFRDLAWLSLDSEAGQEYWNAMNLMAEYATANHDLIHQRVLELAGGKALASVENTHNLAWKEIHNNHELIVHRKGATPAGEGVLGIIPGSMADPAFIVRGKGNTESLRSASHGAGRCMSRTQAIKTLNWPQWKSDIKQRGVRLLSAGLDEVPAVYKPIEKIMAAQTDLVESIGRFDPKLVKMSNDGKAED